MPSVCFAHWWAEYQAWTYVSGSAAEVTVAIGLSGSAPFTDGAPPESAKLMTAPLNYLKIGQDIERYQPPYLANSLKVRCGVGANIGTIPVPLNRGSRPVLRPPDDKWQKGDVRPARKRRDFTISRAKDGSYPVGRWPRAYERPLNPPTSELGNTVSSANSHPRR